MKDNYRAWDIQIEDFPQKKSIEEQLRFLIGFAILAPSSHNSQPWSFEIDQNKIIVQPNMIRSLPHSDTNHRQLFISIGCAIENLLIAADYYGFSTTVQYENDKIGISCQRIKQEQSQDKNHLMFAIPCRHTNRSPYQEQMPEQKFMDWMRGLATNDLHIDFIIDQDQKDKIADVVISAGITAMNDHGFRNELSQYVKSNFTSSPVGMPCFGFGIPAPIALIAPLMMKHLNMNKITKKQDEKLLKRQTPLFVMISTKDDTKESWIKAGQWYERIALEAQQRNIKTAPMAAAIQIGAFYQDIQRILHISYRPQVFFRMGYSDKIMRHSPRLIDMIHGSL